MSVCHAVQHAHQKGIIHRDLKPSNVLVALYDDRPVPKIIDFGVAKATNQQLTEKTLFTQIGQIVGTWEYMSPEQAVLNQLDVDTRTDIYSLGRDSLRTVDRRDTARKRSLAFCGTGGDAAAHSRGGTAQTKHSHQQSWRDGYRDRRLSRNRRLIVGKDAARRSGLDRHEGSGEEPFATIRDSQRACGRPEPISERGTDRSPSALDGLQAAKNRFTSSSGVGCNGYCDSHANCRDYI